VASPAAGAMQLAQPGVDDPSERRNLAALPMRLAI
jgi:hypothetical protein